ncbi:fucose 4-O-acetylase-like acetyltransferase [Frondihabitans sp. PhB188]|uniref:acyltransferase family protein n=1 Tax=Frondihabitans sp. PhB188 TaxID=2485200 RepID=UPI000F469C60|nr:acyltransferase [Frondihabitans sp. PhB188]ROQ41150.1 fucose 4-O-acetylase-like acetyltransferase [Frondihabitans sp. PhB188]
MNAAAQGSRGGGADLSGRDLTVDLARVACVLLVVVIHVLMVGVGVDASGAIVTTRPLEGESWFDAATWFGQIMPLFFVVGGFASATAWASTRRRGGDAGDYVRGRLQRLGRPAAGIYVFLAVGLVVATALGVDAGVLDETAAGIGSPLWFLAAYGITQLFVPAMAHLQATRPVVTLIVLFVGGFAVDVVRYQTHVTNIGLLNLVFVWLFAQQLGFAYAAGWLERARPVVLIVVAAAAYLAMLPLTGSHRWSANMLVDLNPPMTPLMLLAVAQLCLLRLLRPALARLMQTKAARAVVFLVGSRGMTVYLWHLPLLIIVNGALLVVGAPFPDPGSRVWWLTRIPMYLAVIGLAFAVSLVVGRLEKPPAALPAGRRGPAAWVIAVAAVLLIAPPFAVMLDGLDLRLAVIGALALPLGLWLLGRGRPGADAPARPSEAVVSEFLR